jgi:transcriptional regulator with XRE-family HTH domain
MRAADLTLSQAAGAAGVRHEDVQQWLAGTAKPTALELQDLAADLGVNVADFYVRPEQGYQTHSKPGQPMHMKDYVQQREEKRRAHQRELPSLRGWFEQNKSKPGQLVSQPGRDAVARLVQLEREVTGETTVPAKVLAWLGLEQ